MSMKSWPGRRPAQFALALCLLGQLIRLAGGNVGWLEAREWELSWDTVGEILFWIGSVLLLSRVLVTLFSIYVLKRLPGWRMLAAGAVILALAVGWIPEFGINRYAMVARSGNHTDEKPERRLVQRYWMNGYFPLPAIYLGKLVDSTRHGFHGNRSRYEWKGDHSLLSGKVETYEVHRLTMFELATLASLEESKDIDLDGIFDKGFECLTASDTYWGPFGVTDFRRSADDLFVDELVKLCKLVPFPR